MPGLCVKEMSSVRRKTGFVLCNLQNLQKAELQSSGVSQLSLAVARTNRARVTLGFSGPSYPIRTLLFPFWSQLISLASPMLCLQFRCSAPTSRGIYHSVIRRSIITSVYTVHFWCHAPSDSLPVMTTWSPVASLISLFPVLLDHVLKHAMTVSFNRIKFFPQFCFRWPCPCATRVFPLPAALRSERPRAVAHPSLVNR